MAAAATIVVSADRIVGIAEGVGARGALQIGTRVLIATADGAIVPAVIVSVTGSAVVVALTTPLVFAPVTTNNPAWETLRYRRTGLNPPVGTAIDSSGVSDSGDVIFPSADEIGRRLNVPRKIFERKKKKEIIDDHKKESKKIGSTNPDIGIDANGNIVLRHPENKKRTIPTGTPLDSYADDPVVPDTPAPENPKPADPAP